MLTAETEAVLAPLPQTREYQIRQRRGKRVEEIFGWTKTVGGGRKSRYPGVERTESGWS